MTKTQKMVQLMYRNDEGMPFIMTPGQDEIFSSIFQKKYNRIFITAYTQFGKSDVASMAILSRVCAYPEKFAIVAPSDRKAHIIMRYLISHIFDNQIAVQKYQLDPNETYERIRREKNKSHLTFKHSQGYGEVFTFSAEGKRVKDVITSLLGFGAKNVLLDESPTLEEEHYAGVLRMLGGHKDNMLIEIGNAINRNHFYKSSRDANYHKIIIPYTQGISEGRQNESFFDEMKRKMHPQMFSSLYECKFPEADAVDSEGFSPLITENDLDRVQVNDVQLFGEKRLGVDVAGGGRNWSVITLKGSNGARILWRGKSDDTMSLVGTIIRFGEQHKVLPQNVFVDEVGIGRGVRDRLWEEYWKVTGVNFGNFSEKSDAMDYINLRAKCYWLMGQDIKTNTIKLVKSEHWDELLDIRWKPQSDRKIKIMSKEDMARRGIVSPDVADSLALCYARPRRIDIAPSEMSNEEIADMVGVY